ncbi:hypothetical protein TNCT_635521 [Trichonephila clavata]|uniref:Uncharacterized protein n=1 Tax=Trichonephila clavata TaxID=2740835 RepID=A0A8X6FLN1_TRICU|nr:hypothetical protein TNCT_635521 [Trichonephila clavata]
MNRGRFGLKSLGIEALVSFSFEGISTSNEEVPLLHKFSNEMAIVVDGMIITVSPPFSARLRFTELGKEFSGGRKKCLSLIMIWQRG